MLRSWQKTDQMTEKIEKYCDRLCVYLVMYRKWTIYNWISIRISDSTACTWWTMSMHNCTSILSNGKQFIRKCFMCNRLLCEKQTYDSFVRATQWQILSIQFVGYQMNTVASNETSTLCLEKNYSFPVKKMSKTIDKL